jgi:enoyl-CoA hydratase
MSFVLVEKPRPHVTLITLNRPERMNAMAFDVMVPFKEAPEQVSFDNDIRVATPETFFRPAGINNGLPSA